MAVNDEVQNLPPLRQNEVGAAAAFGDDGGGILSDDDEANVSGGAEIPEDHSNSYIFGLDQQDQDILEGRITTSA